MVQHSSDPKSTPLLMPSDQQASMDWSGVAEYLKSQGISLNLRVAPRQFAAGAANLNFLIQIDGRMAVLRRPPHGPLPPGANDIKREYSVLSRLWKHYSYAPRAIHLCTDVSVIGVPFCISEYIDGTPIGATLPEGLASIEDVGQRLGQLTVAALAELHAIDPVAAGMQDIGKGEGFILRQIQGWTKRGSLVLDEKNRLMHQKIADWLECHTPVAQPRSIVHNDFKLDNLLIDPENLDLKGVVDWDMCTIGNPLYELAILLVYWGETDDPHPYIDVARMPYSASGWLTRRDAIRLYLERSPLTLGDFELKFYVLLALFRMVVVYAQLQKMYQREDIKSVAFDDKQLGAAESHMSALLKECIRLTTEELPW